MKFGAPAIRVPEHEEDPGSIDPGASSPYSDGLRTMVQVRRVALERGSAAERELTE